MGAPIFDFRNKPIAALSISYLIDAGRPFNVEQAARYLLQTANEISKRMGCTTDVRSLAGTAAEPVAVR
jgi:DNA-binding IclR family transcriptional regulator